MSLLKLRREIIFDLPDSGHTLTMKALSAKQLDMLGSNKATRGYSDILSQKVVPECLGISFKDYRKFLEGDEMACLIALRRATYGDDYTFKVECPECAHHSSFRVNLAQLPVQVLDPEQPTEGLEYIFDTPDGKRKIVWHIPRVYERISNDKKLKEYIKRNGSEQDHSFVFNMALRIDDILQPDPGNPDHFVSLYPNMEKEERKEMILEELMEAGLSFCQEFFEDISPYCGGIDTSVSFQCDEVNCGHEWNQELPVNKDFFLSTRKSSKKSKASQKDSRAKVTWGKKKSSTQMKNSEETMNSEEKMESGSKQLSQDTSPSPSSPSPQSSSFVPLSSPRRKST